jgi:NDP-sugar pyrophosphorylase family protein
MRDLFVTSFFDLDSFEHAALFKGCAYAWEPLLRISAYLKEQPLGKIDVDIPLSTHLVHPESIVIGEGTIVEPGAYIEGPCIIGRDCQIRHGAYVRGEVITGDGCIIGHDTEVKHSILMKRAFAAHFNYVGDSILGNDVNLGAGVKCANLRLDHEEIVVVFKGQKTSTKLTKLGAIIGDGTQVGCNAVLNPGTLIGKKVICYPCINVGGVIPSGAKVSSSQKMIVEE